MWTLPKEPIMRNRKTVSEGRVFLPKNMQKLWASVGIAIRIEWIKVTLGLGWNCN
jgi:hypothetical protein